MCQPLGTGVMLVRKDTFGPVAPLFRFKSGADVIAIPGTKYLAQQVTGNDGSLDLRGTFVDPEDPQVPQVAFQRKVAGVAVSAVDLQRPVCNAPGRLASVELGKGGVPRIALSRSALAGGLQPQGPRSRQFGGTVGQHPLQPLETADRLSADLAFPGIGHSRIQRGACNAGGLSSHFDTAIVQYLHRGAEPGAFVA